MPEGHKTHFIARHHTDLLGGKTLKITSPQGRFRSGARRLSGEELSMVQAVGKHLFYEFSSGSILHIHLGRYGKFRVHACPPPPPVGAVRVRLISDNAALDLNGPTTCAVISAAKRTEIENRLGPDPLAGGRAKDAWTKIFKSRKPIGALLLDQSVIAGVGNIYRAEALFHVGLDPTTPGNELEEVDFLELWKTIVRMLKVGLKYGKIITVSRAEAGMPLAKLEGNDRFRIFGKEECPECGASIKVRPIASRKMYYCQVCQASE